MTTFQLGIRKHVEGGRSRYWLMINAQSGDTEEDDVNVEGKFDKSIGELESFRKSCYWTLFVSVTILVDALITINYFANVNYTKHFVLWAVMAHCMCLIYWIDIIMYIVQIAPRKKRKITSKLKIATFTIDLISLLPLSAVYWLIEHKPDKKVFFGLRCITLLRLYRIPLYLSRFATAGGRRSFQAFITFTLICFIFSINIFAIIYVLTLPKDQTFDIKDWNATTENTLLLGLYFSFVTHMNTGLGDITPTNTFQIALCAWGMIFGFSLATGVLPAAITNYLSNKEIRRELYRNQRKVTMNTLKRIKIEKRVLEKLSDNLSAMWKHKGGYMTAPPIDVLPRALQKEIYFDINFAFLGRSLLFSMQPRAFLRSACVRMRNWSFLPGEIITEPLGMHDMMLCIASGVVEILSEENNETVLFSLREGSVLGEVKLFISIPTRCIIRASTYVEIQAMPTTNFTRLALKFPDIYRSMREEIRNRINTSRAAVRVNPVSPQTFKRNSLRNFLHDLRQYNKISGNERWEDNLKGNILSMYVLSENIPRVKLLPVELIRKRPWILRPHTPLTKGWNLIIFLILLIVATVYPILGSFVRTLSTESYVLLFTVQVLYAIDLIVQCVTALERDDSYTYITSVKKITAHKFRTAGFYMDVLATLDLTAFDNVLIPSDPDYAFLILSQNKILKVWHIARYFSDVENNMETNLAWVRAFKYILYFSILIIWAGSLVYWEACPGEQCREERWLAQLQKEEVENLDPSPATEYPTILSLYFATILLLGIGYGDIVAKSLPDCLTIIVCLIVGTALVVYVISEAATTSKYAATARSEYQTEIFAVDRFMREHEIPKKTRDYFQLQWNYDQGFSLKHNSIKERLTPQEREIIIKEVAQSMMTVPLFEDTNSNFIRILAKSTNIRVLLPNQTAIKPGSYRQPMYILERGYCEVRVSDKRYVIGPITPLGYVEMILGIPVDMEMITLTHCRIFSLAYSSYLVAITKHPHVKEIIDGRIKRNYPLTNEKGRTQSSEFQYKDVGKVDDSTASRQKEVLSKSFINVYKYKAFDGQGYWEPFRNWGRFRYMQFFFMPFVVTPNSLFLKIWMSIRIVSALLVGLVAPIHFSIPDYTQEWFTVIIILQVFAGIDMYLMFHVGYYDERGLLIFHPAKTVINYLKGSFILDLIAILPFYWLFYILFPTTGRTLSLLYKTPGFLMVIQYYKFSQACYHLEGDVLRQTENIRILKFLPLTMVIANLITGMTIMLECAVYSPERGLGLTTLEREFHRGIAVYCVQPTANVTMPEISPLKFYIIAYYWVIQTLTACGFGDIHAHDSISMIAIIIIGLVGLFLFCYMFANLTSGMFSVHINVTQYRSKVLEMMTFMRSKNVSPSIQRRLILHYGYNWQRTEGQSPQLMFTYLNARLRQNILTSLYGSVIGQIPAFADLEQTILQIIGKQLVEIYFLRGETIVKYNDAQEYIYLIYTGSVNVLDKSGQTITVMGSGGLFGNISNKPFYLSQVEVVATENIDVLELNTENFFLALQAFPKAKQLIEFLTSRTTDYIEPVSLSSDERLRKESTDAHTNEDTIPYEMQLNQRSGRATAGSISEKSQPLIHLYLWNSIFKASKPLHTCVILPESWLHNFIGVCFFILAYVSCAITLYRVAFQDHSLAMNILIYFLDFMFCIKIFLQFFISYFDKNRNYVINMKKIRNRYFKSKKTLGLDIAANLPLDFFAFCAPSDMAPRILSLLRLNRLLRLNIIFEFYDDKFKVLMINKIYLELSRIFVFITLMLHTFACCWYFVACPLGYCQNPSWVQLHSLDKEEDKWVLYVYSIYYVIYVTTSTGYGNIITIKSEELILSIVIMITTRFFIVLLAGSLGSVVHAHKVSIFIYQDHTEELKAYFTRQRISEHQLTKMWNYVTSLWFLDKGKQIPEFINMAPYSMKCDVMNAMFGKHLSQSCIFSNLNEDFTRQLSIYLQRFTYFPGNYIVQQGDIDNTMFFIHKGEVSVLTIHMNLKETIHFTLLKDDHFGLKQGLIAEKAHLFTYRAKTTVEILSLAYKDWQHLLNYFPGVSQSIYYRLGQLT